MKTLDEAGMRRLREAWNDVDVSREDLRSRFGVNDRDTLRLKAEWGPRPVVRLTFVRRGEKRDVA